MTARRKNAAGGFMFLTVDIFQRKKRTRAQNRCRLKREVRRVSKKSRPELENMKLEVAREFGINMNRGYRETSEAGLARLYSRRG